MKYQQIYDVLLNGIKELEKIEAEQLKNPTFGVKKVRLMIKLQKSVLHTQGYRRKPNERNPIAAQVINEPNILPTEKRAKKDDSKYSGRLKPQHGSDIKHLEMEGLNVQQISDKLWISAEKVEKYLKKLKKDRQPRNLIHVTNGKND